MNYKPFDLEKAKAGAPLCTRDGRPARIVCWDVDNNSEGTILALRRNRYDEEVPELYNECGEYEAGSQSALDLFMAPAKHEGWVNVYRGADNNSFYPAGSVHNTQEEANADDTPDRVACVHIKWTED